MSESSATERSIKQERRESVHKAFETPVQDGGAFDPEGEPAPGTEDVGESVTRRAEDVAKTEHEAGRHSTGNDDTPAARPAGTSTPRDVSALNSDES